MKKLSPQGMTIAGLIAAAVLIGAVGYLMVVSPQRSRNDALTVEIEDARTQLTAAEGIGARPEPFRASDLYRFAKAMPNRDDMPGILLDLRGLATASSIDLASVRPSPRVEMPLGYSALPLVVVVRGKYTQISDFLHRLRRDVRFESGNLDVGGRLFLADQLSMQAGDKDILSATLNLHAFVFAAPKPTTSTAGSATPTPDGSGTAATPAAAPAPGATAVGAGTTGSAG